MTTMTAQTTQVYQRLHHGDARSRSGTRSRSRSSPQQYFYGARSRAVDGRRARYAAVGEHRVGRGGARGADPPRRLVHEWPRLYDPELAAEEPSRVTWEIEPQEGGITLLTVVHDQLEGAPKTAESVAGGWMSSSAA